MKRLAMAALLLGAAVCAQDLKEPLVQPDELGRIEWHRDLDAVLAKSPDKPILLLFQEIPG